MRQKFTWNTQRWTVSFTFPAALRNTRPVSVIIFSFPLLQNLIIKQYVATIRYHAPAASHHFIIENYLNTYMYSILL
jgi:hypothetical protein